jgi:hypothetical protein
MLFFWPPFVLVAACITIFWLSSLAPEVMLLAAGLAAFLGAIVCGLLLEHWDRRAQNRHHD